MKFQSTNSLLAFLRPSVILGWQFDIPTLKSFFPEMPAMNGLEAIALLRANPRFGFIPIMALTALAMASDHERCPQVGASEYISKPMSLKMLVKTTGTMLDERKGISQ